MLTRTEGTMEPESTFVKVLETSSLTDIASIKSILDAEAVRYFLQGEYIRYLGPYATAILMVADTDVEKSVELIRPLKLNCVWMIFP